MGIVIFVSFFSSLILALIFTPLMRKLALKLQAFKTDLQHEEPIPYLGGLSVFFAFVLVTLFISLQKGPQSSEPLGILIGAVIIIFLGLVDDFVELSPGLKFFGQAVVIVTLIIFGVKTQIIALGQVANILITFFWMFAMINAFNLLDIMDGLCAGVAVIAAGAFLVVSHLSQNIQAAIICSSLMGAALGFLKYNLPVAQIYLGDTGSMFFGFILAIVAITIDYAPQDREVALLTPIIVLGLPIFDTAFVILMRLLRGRSVIKKSRDHFALRLLDAGLSKCRVLLLMYIFGLFFAVSALVISRVSNRQGIMVLIAIALICGLALKRIGAVKVDE